MSNKIRMCELRNLSVQYAEKDFVFKFYFRKWLKYIFNVIFNLSQLTISRSVWWIHWIVHIEIK